MDRDDLEEKEYLIESGQSHRRPDREARHSETFSGQWKTIAVCVVSIIVGFFAGTLSPWRWQSQTRANDEYFTPISKALDISPIPLHNVRTVPAGLSPFSGPPEKESVDEEWSRFLANVSVKVSKDELQRNGNHKSSVEVSENESLVWLGAFHHIHCLKKIREMNYRDHYHPNMTEKESGMMEVHINHCIEMLRQAIMCNPDLTLTTFDWDTKQTKPVLQVNGFDRQCVDWERFMGSILPRTMTGDEVNALQNPRLEGTES